MAKDASSCILRHMNSCRIFYDIQSINCNYCIFPLALFAGILGSLTRIQYPTPRYGPSAFSFISSVLVKELTFNSYLIAPVPGHCILVTFVTTRGTSIISNT